MLRGFARVARRMVRECDLVARIGGEEFAIYLPRHDDRPGACCICDRLRMEMSRRTISRANSSLIRMTVSGGVGRSVPEGIDQAIHDADQALYRAKRAGRDRFALAA